MHEARFDFNPCEFLALLYLCGGWCFSIEVFDPEHCVFLQLPMQLTESTDTLTCVENCELVVLSFNYTTRWRAVQPHGLQLVSRSTRPSADMASSLPPIVDSVNGLIYYSCCGSCESIAVGNSEDIDT